MITRKLKDTLRETKVRIHGVPFIHRISENKFDAVETWVRADGHGTIRKTDEGKFVARYEKWNDIAKKYETTVIESKDEIKEVVDQMDEDIKEGELKKKAREEGRKRMMGDAADSKFVIMHPKKNLYLTVGGKTWSEKDDPMIKKFKSEAEAEAYAKKNTTNFKIVLFDSIKDANTPAHSFDMTYITKNGFVQHARVNANSESEARKKFELNSYVKRIIRVTLIDAKPEGKAIWVMREDEDFWRPWGARDWTEEDLEEYHDEFKKKGYKKVILVENDGTDPNKTTVHDDYGWEIPTDKAWDAFESVKERLGVKNLLSELTEAMGTADVKEAVEDIAIDWDEEPRNLDELVEIGGEEDVLDAIAQWLSYADLADDLAFICRMHDLHIPELEEEDEIEVDEDVDIEFDDALWAQPDNDAGSAGILTNTPAIRYKDYLILTREDGMYDVYTRRDFDLVGTEYKSVEEAKKNIDEGRKDEHVKTEVEEDFDEDDDEDDDEETVEVEEEIEEETDEETESDEEKIKPDPARKRVSFANHNLVKQEDGTWTILYGGGLNVAARKPVAKGLRSFQEAVKWIFDNVKIQKFPTGATENEQLIMEYMPVEFKDSVDKVTETDIKPGFVFAHSTVPNKHFTIVGNTADDNYMIVRNPKGELEAGVTKDIVHDINNGDLILVSKGE